MLNVTYLHMASYNLIVLYITVSFEVNK